MHRGLLIPTERPPTDIDIKRALLTLDEVQLMNPDDRELIPPEQFAFASSNLVGAPAMPIFTSQGPVLPLGKITRYNETFEQTLEECKAAVQRGAVVVRSAPTFMGGLSLGGPQTPEGWPNSTFTLGVFKALGGDPQIILKALEGVAGPDAVRQFDAAVLAPLGVSNTMSLQVGSAPFEVPMNTAVAPVELQEVPDDLRPLYTRLAAGRLGSVVKSLGMCHLAGLHPVSVDKGVNALLSHLQDKSTAVLQNGLAAENDPGALQLALRVERILFGQMLPDQVIGALTIEEVLHLRSKAWGTANEHKIRLLQTVRDMAHEVADLAEFDTRVLKEATQYQKANQALDDELKIKGLRAGGWALSGGAATMAKNLVEQALGLGSWELALFLGAGLAIKQLAPDAVTLVRNLTNLRASTGKVLLRTYSVVLRGK